ncbi:hypothetical protein [Pedococcus cremeus]|uniref:hypothetical protein n=1 Tax=Pedococcus cremeus TaxID=587636 RepID=UPI000B8A0EF8|nr:hypothetical protein [Pedococcus cremeus]
MTSSSDASTIAQAVTAFFPDHEVAGLRLPPRWFGRPFDNWHQMSQAATDGDRVMIRLDSTQILTLDAQDASLDGRMLRIVGRGGSWSWTEYGGDVRHEEVLGSGCVEFSAPFHH